MGDLDERADIAGDRSAPEHTERRQHGVIIRLVGVRRRCHAWHLGVRVADDRHHGYRRDPPLLSGRGRGRSVGIHAARIAVQLGISLLRARIVRERRRLIGAAPRRIAEQLEAAAEWGQEWKISVAGTAGLSGLTRETRKRLRRWRKANCQEASEDDNNRGRSEQPVVSKGAGRTAAIALHHAIPLFAALRVNARILNRKPLTTTTIVQETRALLS